VTRLRTGLSTNRGSIYCKDRYFFLSASCPIQLPIQCVLEALSADGKQSACEADRSALTIAEVSNGWSHISIPLYAFMSETGGHVLRKIFHRLFARSNFTRRETELGITELLKLMNIVEGVNELCKSMWASNRIQNCHP